MGNSPSDDFDPNKNGFNDAFDPNKNGLNNTIFLFCCGPFGNILCKALTEFNDQNTYLDIGSTLNPFLGTAGFDREYYMGDNMYSRLTCSWGK
jgi:hypothetical protein